MTPSNSWSASSNALATTSLSTRSPDHACSGQPKNPFSGQRACERSGGISPNFALRLQIPRLRSQAACTNIVARSVTIFVRDDVLVGPDLSSMYLNGVGALGHGTPRIQVAARLLTAD